VVSVLKKEIFLASFLIFSFVISSSVFALSSFTFSVTPSLTNVTANRLLNFTINNTDSSGANITELNITFPTDWSIASNYIQNSYNTTVSSSLINTVNIEDNTKTFQWTNKTPEGFVNNTTAQYFWFNVSLKSPSGLFNFSITTLDTSGNENSTNVTIAVNGPYLKSPTHMKEFGTTTVSFNCSAYSDTGSLQNISIYLWNASYNVTGSLFTDLYYIYNATKSGYNNYSNYTATNLPKTGYILWGCLSNDTSRGEIWTTDNYFVGVSLSDLYGYIMNSTGLPANNTNVSIYRHIEQQGGPPLEQYIISNVTNESGYYNVFDINISQATGPQDMFLVKLISYNSTSGNATEVGPTLPPFPRDMLFKNPGPFYPPMPAQAPGFDNSTVYLQPAGTLRLSAYNASGNSLNFGYEVMDQTLGFPIKSCIQCNVSSVNIVVPRDRNYTVMFLRDPQIFCPGGFGPACTATPPMSRNINNVSSYSSSDYVVNVSQNLSFSDYNLTGYINVIGNTSAVTITKIIPRMVPWPGFVPPVKGEREQFNVSDDEDYNSTNTITGYNLGSYRTTLMGSDIGINYMIEFYGNNSNEYFAAFQNITVSGNTSVNVTLRRLAGVYTTGGDVNTSKTIINIQNETGAAITTNAHVEVLVRDSNIYNGDQVHFIIESLTNGSFSMPFLNTSTVKINVFSQDSAPMSKKINLSNSVNNITLQRFKMEKLNATGKQEFDNTTKALIDVKFFRYDESVCNVFNPPSSCQIGGGFKGDFDPFQAMLAGKVNLWMHLTTSNITLYFINVDLLASGPPDAQMSESAITNTTTSTSLQQAWRFGSMAPDIYDYVLIGIPLVANTSWSYNMSIPALYDEDWNSVWSTGSALPYDYSEYNVSGYSDYLTSNGKTCSMSSSTSYCFINTTENKLWMRIPHFSGVQPQLNGAAPATTTTDGTTGTTGTIGGITTTARPYISLKTGKVNITMSSITTGGKMIATIARYEDIAIREMNITVLNNVANIKIMMTKLSALPSTVPYDIDGKIYHYINIEKINITDSDINTVDIEFAVNKTWLTDSNVDASNITLYRWANNQWNDLGATKIAESDQEVFYHSSSPGLSVFIIGTKGGAPELAPTGAAIVCEESWSCTEWSECIDDMQTRTCTDSSNCGTTVNKPTESQACEVEKALIGVTTVSILTNVIVIVVAIIVCIFIFLQRSKITSYLEGLSKKTKRKSTKILTETGEIIRETEEE